MGLQLEIEYYVSLFLGLLVDYADHAHSEHTSLLCLDSFSWIVMFLYISWGPGCLQ
jgi:hypothetical protein